MKNLNGYGTMKKTQSRRISMFTDVVAKYYEKELDYNCAETMLYAANEYYELNLSKDAMKTVASFGGGMAIGNVCGAITGCLAALGVIFTKEKAHESDKIKILTKRFIESFGKRFGYIDCAPLKDVYKTEEKRCSDMIVAAAEIMEEVVAYGKTIE
jgi:C_GCAxxG_C_C family probable redox protein